VLSSTQGLFSGIELDRANGKLISAAGGEDVRAGDVVVGAYDPDGAWTAAALPVTAAGPNQAPVNHVPGEQAVPPPGPVIFSAANGNAITVSDADAGDSPVRVTLTARGGTVILSSGAGLTFESGGPTGTRQAVFLGTVAAVNAALEGMQFKFDLPTQFGNSLTISTDDLGNTGTRGALGDTGHDPHPFLRTPAHGDGRLRFRDSVDARVLARPRRPRPRRRHLRLLDPRRRRAAGDAAMGATSTA
jgi:hypothetical protein